MNEIRDFIEQQQKENPRAEPNGEYSVQILKYAIKYWEGLTGFLKYPGAKIDNNPTESQVKTINRHHSNSRKYLTEHGASIGDFCMSLIDTCRINKYNPIDYLEFCITHRKWVADDPELFLPWNYQETKKAFEEELKNRPRYRIAARSFRHNHPTQEIYAQ